MHNAAETYLGAVALADDGAALKQEIEEMVYQMVLTVLDRMLMNGDGRFGAVIGAALENNKYRIQQMALQAVKGHFNNPQPINY